MAFGTVNVFGHDGESTGTTDRYSEIATDHSQNVESSESDVEEPNLQLQIQQTKIRAQQDAFHDFLRSAKPESIQSTKSDDGSSDRARLVTQTSDIDRVRNYQQELFERALEENVIAVLDTGSGKTLIACLLVRHMRSQELLNRGTGSPFKTIFFLANSVHLVQQQAKVLAKNVGVEPWVFVGDSRVETWKKFEKWSEITSSNLPIVCTPAILQQCLDSALVQLRQVSLLIFDEAHHAKKNHPYSRIIRTHYLKCPSEQRPRIFGMTASPMDTKGNIDSCTADLEELLQCKIITTDDPRKLSMIPKPKDVIWRYRKPRPSFETDLYQFIWARCSSIQDFKRGFVFAKEATSTLGPWCADNIWKHVVGTSEHESSGLIKRFEQSPAYIAIESVVQRKQVLEDLQEVITSILQFDFTTPTPDPFNLSSKVLRLYEELHTTYVSRPHTRSIVFVDQRFTAQVLCDCFLKLNIPNMRPATLLGTSSDSASLKKQEQFLDHFRAGLVNLIFATSVADEGIDIPECNLCIRFDLYKSPIQYIQSRGRARMENSIYAHMIEEDNALHESEVEYATKCDVYIKEYCSKLSPDRLLGKGTKLERMIATDSSMKSFKTIMGAICDFGNCLQILSQFTSSLRYLGAIENESYEEEIDVLSNLFRYIVRLPAISEISVKGARGDWRPNKQLARRSAAWNCCYLLRRHNLLDDTLSSKFKKMKPENINARLAVSTKQSAYTMITKPSAWKNDLGCTPTRLYLTFISLDPSRQLKKPLAKMVLLTRIQMPNFPDFVLYLEDGIETRVSTKTMAHSLAVSREEVDLLTTFTLDGVFLDVFNKVYDHDNSKVSYWLAPLTTLPNCTPSKLQDVVDTKTLSEVKRGRIKWTPGCSIEESWTGKFICDPRNGKYHFFSHDVVPGVNIFDPVPSTVPSIPQKGMKSIIDFSDSSWRASKKNFVAATYDRTQPVLSAELLMARRNFLEPPSTKEGKPIQCMIAPQPLEVSRLDPEFAASCFAWPAIIHRLESYMIALEAFDKLGLNGVSADLALEAFTKDSDINDQENQVHTGAQRGMGKNYERLEFIGDSLLKMMTTITVYNRTKMDEEGMHCRRMEILCNRRLFDVSTEKYQLHHYARTSAFNRITWYPEHLVLLKGRGVKKEPEAVKHAEMTQALGMKTIADISEAIIGAAVTASRGSQNPLDLGIKAITQLVDSEDHAITAWSQIAAMYEAPEWSLKLDDVQANKLAEDVATKTGYHFKHPRLLRSAFTHSSDVNATVPDLQRLEFLGDAVLDWVSISWLFDTFPDRNPQWLTEHKMAMVSNKYLAALAVVLDFDKFMYCSTTKLYADITFYAGKVREMYAKEDVDPDFWTRIDSPPKALSDLVESYLGAVLVDSNFNYQEIEKFFDKHVLWFFKDMSRYDTFANRHPTTFLLKKVNDEFKCKEAAVIASDPREGESHVEFKITAGALIHNHVIADASGTSARYAKVRASQQALRKLEGMKIEDFRRIFGCHCKLRAE